MLSALNIYLSSTNPYMDKILQWTAITVNAGLLVYEFVSTVIKVFTVGTITLSATSIIMPAFTAVTAIVVSLYYWVNKTDIFKQLDVNNKFNESIKEINENKPNYTFYEEWGQWIGPHRFKMFYGIELLDWTKYASSREEFLKNYKNIIFLNSIAFVGLSNIDKRIEVQRKLIENYKSLIKIIKNVVLPPKFNIKQKLGHFLIETNERVENRTIRPVAVGALGIRKRTDIFDKELSNDYSKNKVIHNGDLCFGIGTNQIVFDILNENKLYGVSQAYKTFRISKIKSIVLKLILDNNNQLFSKRHMIISARQGKSVNFKDLLQESINYPD